MTGVTAFQKLLKATQNNDTELALSLLKQGSAPSVDDLNLLVSTSHGHGSSHYLLTSIFLTHLKSDDMAYALLSSIFSDPDRLIPKDERELAALILPGLSNPLKEGPVRDLVFRDLPQIDLSVETISRLFNAKEALRFITLSEEREKSDLGLSRYHRKHQP